MRIAVDAMGGDHAPRAVVEGAVRAVREDGLSVLLVGREEALGREVESLGGKPDLLEILHADEVVEMDEPGTAPIRRKRRSSIRVCAELVHEGRAQALVSAGNTGAALAVSKMIVGVLPGVDRPALAGRFPSLHGETILLDVGANIDSKPRHYVQFAVMGHVFAQAALGVESPRIGLLSVGEEATKGTELLRSVYQELTASRLNFIGNVEGGDLLSGKADVVVCDGFVGNVLLKSAESIARLLGRLLRDRLQKDLRTRLGAYLARPAFQDLRRRTDPDELGAAPLLGVQAGCFIAHGGTGAKGIRSAVRSAAEFVQAGVHDQIRKRLEEMGFEGPGGQGA